MAIARAHVPYFREIFSLPGFLREPLLQFGYQDTLGLNAVHDPRWRDATLRQKLYRIARAGLHRIEAWTGRRHRDLSIPDAFRENDLVGILAHYGVRHVQTIDGFDARADYPLDMNRPLPAELREKFNTVIDIGSTEHVFDTRQCLENLINLVAKGGHLMLHLPCKGYYNHGLHTFSPECIVQTLVGNGFEVVYLKFSSTRGALLRNPGDAADVLIWVVARKTATLGAFVVPQQGRWRTFYRGETQAGAQAPGSALPVRSGS